MCRSYIPYRRLYRDRRISISEEALGAFGKTQTYRYPSEDIQRIYKLFVKCRGYVQGKRCSELVASIDKEVNMAAGDSDDALVCCAENTVEDRIMDSGASFHATYCKEELERIKLHSSKLLLYPATMILLSKTVVGVAVGLMQTFRIVMLKMVPGIPLQFGVAERLSQTFRAESMGLRLRIPEEEWRGKDTSLIHLKAAAQMKCDTAFGIRRVSRLSEAEISHLWTRFMEPENDNIVAEHGLSSEITQSPGRSSDTSERSENNRSFEDSGRSDGEYSEDGASSKEGGFETPQVRRSTRESSASERYSPSANYLLGHKSKGFKLAGQEENLECRLKEILYGLIQAPRLRQLLNVDDMLVARSDMAEFNKPKW
ncbi:hypothetical protein Tco_0331022 [Tanacetum coccineum]